jgi:hypothetical protein
MEAKGTKTRRKRILASDEDKAMAFETIERECDVATAEAFSDWLTYKSERREDYTPTGLKSLVAGVCKDYRYGWDMANAMRRAMAAQWMGFNHANIFVRRQD